MLDTRDAVSRGYGSQSGTGQELSQLLLPSWGGQIGEGTVSTIKNLESPVNPPVFGPVPFTTVIECSGPKASRPPQSPPSTQHTVPQPISGPPTSQPPGLLPLYLCSSSSCARTGSSCLPSAATSWSFFHAACSWGRSWYGAPSSSGHAWCAGAVAGPCWSSGCGRRGGSWPGRSGPGRGSSRGSGYSDGNGTSSQRGFGYGW